MGKQAGLRITTRKEKSNNNRHATSWVFLCLGVQKDSLEQSCTTKTKQNKTLSININILFWAIVKYSS